MFDALRNALLASPCSLCSLFLVPCDEVASRLLQHARHTFVFRANSWDVPFRFALLCVARKPFLSVVSLLAGCVVGPVRLPVLGVVALCCLCLALRFAWKLLKLLVEDVHGCGLVAVWERCVWFVGMRTLEVSGLSLLGGLLWPRTWSSVAWRAAWGQAFGMTSG